MQKTISPIDNKVYIEREYDSHKIEETLNNSVKAQISWGQISVKERVELLGKFVEDFLSKKEIITEELCRQIGRPISQVAGELNGFKERADYMLSIAENKLADIDVTKDNNFKNFIRRKPLGVVFVIAPWNYPYLTAVNSIIPAMAAGNTVILKHSAQTPLCAEQLYKSAQKTLPKNVFNYLEDWNSSDQMYEDLISTDQTDSQALNNYSYTLAERGVKLSTALDMAQKAISLDPKNPAYLDTIGWIYFKLKKYKKALNYIEQSVLGNENNPVVLEHLGDVLMKVNRSNDARVYYQKALDIDIDNVRLIGKIKE